MKLEELTNKIYAEGVEKGNAEAREIVAKAEENAQAIVAKAEQEAAAIVEKHASRRKKPMRTPVANCACLPSRV